MQSFNSLAHEGEIQEEKHNKRFDNQSDYHTSHYLNVSYFPFRYVFFLLQNTFTKEVQINIPIWVLSRFSIENLIRLIYLYKFQK